MTTQGIAIEEIGIRELKARASELVRVVKERRARYVITQRGRQDSGRAPLDALSPQPDAEKVWAWLEALGQEIARNWHSDKSAVEILSEMRR